ncbi:NAD-dependent epimerase/dehydratase family protein [Nocardia amamiensis]|uniref:NAD-dependent epimerase/dehydratase family protein n=1 Tax=Nocardia amamiensis TaxID=404578 RepID=UPI00082B0FDF|nr:NAD-dependent epimerase/dehydratase family protein [Nocardia amamiensis]
MRVLLIGGTGFIGRHLIAECFHSGYEVTVVSRGITGVELLHDSRVTHVRADRNNLTLPAGPGWDIAVDVNCFDPLTADLTAHQLVGRAHRAILISTVSVYTPMRTPGIVETSALPTTPPRTAHERYGRLKAAAENAYLAVFGDRLTVLRAGPLIGPYDNLGRLPFWIDALLHEPTVVVPAAPTALQLLDVRDLAAFALLTGAIGASGTFNVVGATHELQRLLRDLADAWSSTTHLIDIPDRQLMAAGVTPWEELPYWLPSDDPDHPGMNRIGEAVANDLGLQRRPVLDTATATRDWMCVPDQTAPRRIHGRASHLRSMRQLVSDITTPTLDPRRE